MEPLNSEPARKDVTFGDFIFELPKQLTPQFCKHLINRYETDPVAVKTRNSGRTFGSDGFQALKVKQSEDFQLSRYTEFVYEDKTLNLALEKLLRNYIDHLVDNLNPFFAELMNFNYEDSGFQIQRTMPHGFYSWHNDAHTSLDSGAIKTRSFTYIFYLNDVNNAGETEFANGRKVKPEEGKALLFPANWEYLHRGVAPVDEIKYITTGWVSALYPTPEQNSTEPKTE
jgi:hypothetical protein